MKRIAVKDRQGLHPDQPDCNLSSAGIKMTHVPYKGGAPALMDVLGGNVNIMIIQPTSKEQITSGQLKALAVSSSARSSSYPAIAWIAAVSHHRRDARK